MLMYKKKEIYLHQYKAVLYRLWYDLVNGDIRTIEGFFKKSKSRMNKYDRAIKYMKEDEELSNERIESLDIEAEGYKAAFKKIEDHINENNLSDIDDVLGFVDEERKRLGVVLAHEDPKETEKLMRFLGSE